MGITNFVGKYKKLIVFLASCCVIVNLCLYWPDELEYSSDTFDYDFKKFVVYNNKCTMPEIDPWSSEALLTYHKIKGKYKDDPPLVKMKRDNDIVYLLLEEGEDAWNKSIGYCISCVVLAGTEPIPDNNYQIIDCENFTGKVIMRSSVMYVECFSLDDSIIYRDVLANYVWNNLTVIKPIETQPVKPFNLIIIGYDSISRQNLQRTMPATFKHLHSNGWIEFVGYNKIAENTLTNLIGILTGQLANNTHYYDEIDKGFFDNEAFLWKEYQKLGYVTVFVEDNLGINTFNNNYKGFRKSPTDFYFRPFTNILESLSIDRLSFTSLHTGKRLTAQRILDLASQLPLSLQNQSYFGFFWMSTFSHDNINAPQFMDARTVEFFKKLIAITSKDTFVIFTSDHGFRMGPLRKTLTGWYEDRMPFLYIFTPESFKERNQKEYQNMVLNSKKLVSGFDLYMTLQDILALSNIMYITKPAMGCPQCTSLFKTIPDLRSCSEAGILEIYCTCSVYNTFDKKHKYVKQAAKRIVAGAQELLDGNQSTRERCWALKLARIVYVKASQLENSTTHTMLLLTIETNPKIVLEGIVRVDHTAKETSYKLVGDVIRIDTYKDTSKCVIGDDLKRFCYCSPYGHLLSFFGF